MARQDALLETSFLTGGNAAYLEELQAAYARDPHSVDQQWQDFFKSLGDESGLAEKNAAGASWQKPNWPVHANGEMVSALDGNWATVEKAVGDKIRAKSDTAKLDGAKVANGAAVVAASGVSVEQATKDSVRAIMLIRAYRMRGHLHAKLDPLGLAPRGDHEELHPQHYGFEEKDWDRPIFLDNVLGLQYSTIREIVEILERTYCQTLGVEFMHISNPEEKAWIQERIEGKGKEISFTPEGRRAILNKLVEAEGFEKFLDLKYTGTKRFGLDGSESMIPALEQIIKRGGALGAKEIVLGMAHRGRLNVLSNVMSKPFRAIFNEFKGGSASPAEVEGSGDVKYHLGASSDRTFDDNNVHLSLTANPSHLEIVDPVVLGKVRAKQDQRAKPNVQRTSVVPLLIHGDAAFAGQGVVAECLGLSGLKGHRTGGSIHFIINNQIGFTTDPRFSRSSPYPSDVAKMVEAPIFHCNGDDPEAVTFAAKIAIEYRQKFGKPVVIDMLCYRRFGHNEGDEPAFTQPKMYQRIRKHPTALETYAKRLIAEGVLTQEQFDTRKAEFRAMLDGELEVAGNYKANKADWLDGRWSGFKAVREDVDDPRRGKTGVPADTLREIAQRITTPPPGFHLHRTIQRFFDNRAKAVETGKGIDWATAEALAIGSLLIDGHRVRLSGQDVERGTFSQRHAVVIDQENEQRYTSLNSIREGQANLEVINSMLSEEAVLGFEYGYSLAEPNALVLWEAQFGDFANGAQVVIDQFISSGERKWLRMSGLTLLLPHGYEGQGPEHSSARLERFLQMCAEDNMQVANCTTPSNYFHILRRQLNREFRKPLVLMTPKSLLRHKRAVSNLDMLAEGSTFHRVLWDDAEHEEDGVRLVKDDKVRRVVLCSGKVYYDLYDEREKRGVNDVYLMRVEQLYPFPLKALANEMARFRNAEVVWCQEEPKNMGAWSFVDPYLEWVLGQAQSQVKRARYVGRPASASTAVGLLSKHQAQLQAFLNEALAA
ncbi:MULTISPECIES: 2-oxoglutarate dehydrogenase E1 component [Methylobacterium]|uniref:2-oxoglutarate dehydrogenase E1 component n=1 Tax=Methylobacterium bullatum TaxID=570505 RepID=A0A679JS10_9HYPH|nr:MULTISPECIES: 2-oxoglutarate dehydrogenase E1 component [Methylobacterium]KQP39129.1 2-oxoglutarate dehydrogenase subunit E1 [Methylobacterium sp. Leaf106]MBD8900885.1 2-oxoglutarate dehydrogenase E1 component [Methylobacterium bullatum]TXN26123.1 2-oxoglutarate dehydrogenase E1 component [Methylobacterium sp. WL19]CAA2137859.1 2-oxoglutarate dehydrogenase E1 component [Methylobacterium bullatum]GJD41579.1 2-oxoglutarate dehydrogenase E1 component [Methylobacterium bullatum]